MHIQYPLHCGQYLLIRCGVPFLIIRDNRWGRITFGCKVLLVELWSDVLTSLGDRSANFGPHLLELDDILAAIDFRQVLAFNAWF